MRKVLIISALLACCATATANVHDGDKAVLVKLCPWFKNATTTPKWQAFCADTTNIDPAASEVEGIQFIDENYRGNVKKRVARIELSDKSLSGTIPGQLALLSKLSWLNLSNNQLSGTIPKELSWLRSLKYLFLGGNKLSGTIPTEIGNLEKLEELNLRDNELLGTIPAEMGNLANLIGLHLGSNTLSGNSRATRFIVQPRVA